MIGLLLLVLALAIAPAALSAPRPLYWSWKTRHLRHPVKMDALDRELHEKFHRATELVVQRYGRGLSTQAYQDLVRPLVQACDRAIAAAPTDPAARARMLEQFQVLDVEAFVPEPPPPAGDGGAAAPGVCKVELTGLFGRIVLRRE